MKNEDVNRRIKEAGLLKCQVARKMGIFEHDLYRMLSRKELSEEKKKEVLDAVEALTGGKHE